MPEQFDPYRTWFGISANQQPPDHYQLLGIRRFESDLAKIEQAVDQRFEFLQDVAAEQTEYSQRILNEVAAARLCLMQADSKRAYDAELKSIVRRGSNAITEPNSTPNKRPAGKIDSTESSDTKPAEARIGQSSRRKYHVALIALGGALVLSAVFIVAILSWLQPDSEDDKKLGSQSVPAAKPIVTRQNESSSSDKSRNAKSSKKKSNDRQGTKSKKSSTGSKSKKQGSSDQANKTNNKISVRPADHQVVKSKPSKKTKSKTSSTTQAKPGNRGTAVVEEAPARSRAGQVVPVNGLVVWLNANDSRLQDGPISEWPNHFLPMSKITAKLPLDSQRPVPSDAQPTRVPNAINGLPAIRFDGADEKGAFLVLGDLSGHFSNRATMFAVVRPRDNDYNVYVTNQVDAAFRSGRFSRAAAFAKDGKVLFTGFPANGLHCITLQCLPNSQSVWIDGNLMDQKNGIPFEAGRFHRIGSPSSFDTKNRLWQSRWRRQFFKGEMGEILIYNRRLSQAQRQQVENYLFHKWGAGKQYGPVPRAEQFGWEPLIAKQATVYSATDKSNKHDLLTTNGNFSVPESAGSQQQTCEIHAPMIWPELTAIRLTVPVGPAGKSERFSLKALEIKLLPIGDAASDHTPIEFELVDCFVENAAFAIDKKPRPWTVPVREHPTQAIIFFKKPLKQLKQPAKLVVTLEQKNLSKFQLHVIASKEKEPWIRFARKTSGQDVTHYAPDVWAINFGGDTMFDGTLEWTKAVPFNERTAPFGFVGGNKRNFQGDYWRTCHEGLQAIRANVKNRRYDMRLVFADPTDTPKGQREFSINVEGVGIPSFDIKTVLGQKFKSRQIETSFKDKKTRVVVTIVNKDFFVVDINQLEIKDKRLDIRFQGTKGKPLISAIVVKPSGK